MVIEIMISVCCCAATASIAIHRLETKQIVDNVLRDGHLQEDCNV